MDARIGRKHVCVAGFLTIVLLISACGDGSGESRAGGPAEAQQGKTLYDEKCASCHGGDSGGEISDSPPPHNANGHTWHHADCLLADITLRGAAAWGADPSTSAMPAFRDELTEEDVESILVYIKTWWTDEQREYQSDLTKANCGS